MNIDDEDASIEDESNSFQQFSIKSSENKKSIDFFIQYQWIFIFSFFILILALILILKKRFTKKYFNLSNKKGFELKFYIEIIDFILKRWWSNQWISTNGFNKRKTTKILWRTSSTCSTTQTRGFLLISIDFKSFSFFSFQKKLEKLKETTTTEKPKPLKYRSNDHNPLTGQSTSGKSDSCSWRPSSSRRRPQGGWG